MCEVVAAPRPGRSLPGPGRFRTVVAREYDDGVVTDAEFIDRIEDLSHVRVHFRQGVGEIAEAGLARELGIRESREVDLRERHVGGERSTRLHAALDEIDRRAGHPRT